MDYSLIKKELEFKDISFRDLCYRIDVTEQGLHQMIRKKSMKVDTLERISIALGLPVSYWFEHSADARSTMSTENDIPDRMRRYLASKVSHAKIDSLTRNLNEMLKEMAAR